MDELMVTAGEALRLLVSFDPALWEIIGVSFRVSLTAILVSLPPSLLLALLLARVSFPGRWLAISVVNTLMAVPTVVVGLVLFMLLSRSGPLGELRLLFTQRAMIVGQILLAMPILTAMLHSTFQSLDQRAWETARLLGASWFQALWMLIREARFGVIAALLAAFGRIIAEVGSAVMIGGNIEHFTRTITTAIALETLKGEFAQGLALGLVLLLLALLLNVLLGVMRGRGQQTVSV
ncbi:MULTISPECIES: ABC transporter permease [Chromohalobacter]|uniref:ABC transporter permease n=1 Tax=Chromohalobacter TaxID=42054 RepID=UPI000D719F69|nr:MULTISPECIES: ABC transporter permease [Chromohalobacter]MBZ5874798.1 ABC transporter permease [Chromohalobacter salexigens]MDO0946422.1 ABC transporter permease [Chromohalobacter salexigens]NQY46218.1 ABC transporter permease [Chromohalobacter sp.]NWO56837.1 ABC transporter permease [Chromohalobacter salexigens]PWW41764.1 tungstate transport system permease protein [Chromohalobacter salexigens]